ncbi:heme-degrading domain-containing protein [Aquamicrobium sp. LC103]|uniref:heme-degrading domain-containing protein n=1 Tax=Aquamicrobium sp. LC103 TaxID=1120658 RepID=UPI00063EBD02|nr:heme-degrading domain-containing protein [Aquamicrobium sp. LC103]TKT77616.1 heme-degrading domain-containing protein [Aquamicrobium sp. LC103]
MVEDDLKRLIEQEKKLVFPAFDEEEAFKLGTHLRDMALDRKLPIVIDIRLWDRPLFFAALPGSAGANAEWARRKINSVMLYHKCSYRMFLEQGAKERIFPADYGHVAQDFAIAGGAFPIRVQGVGAIGALAVSGLPQREDHNLVVAALASHLGADAEGIALSPPADR